MAQSHTSYSRLGLDSEGTDLLCRLVEEHKRGAEAQGTEPQVYGAKITGGGSGGTVCLLGYASPAATTTVNELSEKYCQATGHRPVVFRSSSMGAFEFGHLRIRYLSAREGGANGSALTPF
mmetsp:Transcript_2886/g.5162  ORF Transcript_2886/g.5162 Transcript_2886/m.5162 type:complete len:121 (+) Transcript_2886:3011-3373(+)